MHDALFRHFGVAGLLVDKEGSVEDIDVTVIMNFGVESVDEYGEVVDRVDKADFRNTLVMTKRGQRLTVTQGEFTGNYTLGRKLKSNGYLESREIVRDYNE